MTVEAKMFGSMDGQQWHEVKDVLAAKSCIYVRLQILTPQGEFVVLVPDWMHDVFGARIVL